MKLGAGPRWAAAVVAVVVGTAMAVTAHLRWRGEAALAECDTALAAGDTPTAIERARDAAMAVAPGSPYPGQGYARLAAIAERAEEKGDFDQATAAWRASLAALRSTRSDDLGRVAAAGSALIRLAEKRCEGDESRPAAVCAAAARSALATSALPPVGRLEGLGVGAFAFLIASAWASQAKAGRARLASLAIALTGAAVATISLLSR